MRDKRAFDLGVVLSVTTDKLLCKMGDVYEILNYLTGADLFTHQLPRAGEACKPHILEQVSALADVDASEVNRENWEAWLNDAKSRYGDLVLLEPISLFGYQRKDPVDEMVEMVGEDKVTICTSFP